MMMVLLLLEFQEKLQGRGWRTRRARNVQDDEESDVEGQAHRYYLIFLERVERYAKRR
jgi:hypothetical protein